MPIPTPPFSDSDILARMQGALMAWRRVAATIQAAQARKGEVPLAALAVAMAPSKHIDSDLEAIAHAFDGFPSLWAHITDLRAEVERLERTSARPSVDSATLAKVHLAAIPIDEIERLRAMRAAYERSPQGGWGEPSLAAREFQEAAAAVVTKLLGPGAKAAASTGYIDERGQPVDLAARRRGPEGPPPDSTVPGAGANGPAGARGDRVVKFVAQRLLMSAPPRPGPKCRGPYRMDAPGGPVCSCGQPSTHESGWCGRPPRCALCDDPATGPEAYQGNDGTFCCSKKCHDLAEPDVQAVEYVAPPGTPASMPYPGGKPPEPVAIFGTIEMPPPAIGRHGSAPRAPGPDVPCQGCDKMGDWNRVPAKPPGPPGPPFCPECTPQLYCKDCLEATGGQCREHYEPECTCYELHGMGGGHQPGCPMRAR